MLIRTEESFLIAFFDDCGYLENIVIPFASDITEDQFDLE